MNITTLQHLNFLSTHPQWRMMSWETRGMALELMSIPGNDDFAGTVAPEDELWRNTLNIPHARLIQAALKKSVQGRGLREQNELEIVWTQVWKPELCRWFRLIDEAFIATHPHYAPYKGRFWHPLLDEHPTEEDKQPKSVKKSKTIQQKTLQISHDEQNAIKVARSKKTKKQKLVEDPTFDYALVRFTLNTFKSCWEEPLTREARSDLWKSAVGLLAPNGDSKNEAIARQFIGKLIKEFGEKNTASAVAQLLVRPIPPADPKSFLRRQLKNLTEGSSSVQKANEQRIRVPL